MTRASLAKLETMIIELDIRPPADEFHLDFDADMLALDTLLSSSDSSRLQNVTFFVLSRAGTYTVEGRNYLAGVPLGIAAGLSKLRTKGVRLQVVDTVNTFVAVDVITGHEY